MRPKKGFRKWISRQTNSNQFQDIMSNNITGRTEKLSFWISGINGLNGATADKQKYTNYWHV